MCNFFSFVTDEKGNKYYFDWEQRQKHITEGKSSSELDSHSYIANYYNFKDTTSQFSKKQEKYLNKYEYNPLTKEFTKDYIGKFDDSKEAEEWVKSVDFKTIIKPLIIKPFFNPLTDRNPKTVTKKDKELLEQWASVRASVGYSVWDSVWDSVRNSLGSSVWDSVWNSVWASVRDSVGNNVRDSVGDSIWAYTSSHFDIEFDYDFSPVVKLWERGYVPSFDGKAWRLHKGPDAKIVYTWEKGE